MTSNWRTSAVVISLICSSVNSAAQARQPLEVQLTRNLIVEINSMSAGVGVRGAGIVIGGSDDSVFIATTYHVVADKEDSTINKSIVVSFGFEDGLKRPATVRSLSEVNLDLAIVTVRGVGTKERWMMMPMYRQGSALRSRPGTQLFLLGCPDGQRCGEASFDRAAVARQDGDGLAITVPNLALGYSGGAVCTPDGSIVGMIKAEPNVLKGHAIPIEDVLAFARGAGVPVSLREPRWPLAETPLSVTLDGTVAERGRGGVFGGVHLRAAHWGEQSAELGYVVMSSPSLRLQAGTETVQSRLRFSLGGMTRSGHREGRIEGAIGLLAPVAVYRRKSSDGYYLGEQAFTATSGSYTFNSGSATLHTVTIGSRVVTAGGMAQLRAMLTRRSERRPPYSLGLVTRFFWVPSAQLSTWFVGLSTELLR